MKDWTRTILYIALALLVLPIGLVLIDQGAEIFSDLCSHILKLFRRARIFGPNAEFAQLLFIAIFAGWAISRLKGKK